MGVDPIMRCIDTPLCIDTSTSLIPLCNAVCAQGSSEISEEVAPATSETKPTRSRSLPQQPEPLTLEIMDASRGTTAPYAHVDPYSTSEVPTSLRVHSLHDDRRQASDDNTKC